MATKNNTNVDITTPEEVIKRIQESYRKRTHRGWVYFIDAYPYPNVGLFRARPDGADLIQITTRCDKFEVKGNIIHTSGFYSELDETGYLFDRYSYEEKYQVDDDNTITRLDSIRAYIGSSD